MKRLEAIILIIVFTLIMSPDLLASGYHGEHVVNNTTTIKKDIKSAMALAIGNNHLDPRYIPLQGSVAVGSMNGSNAISFAAGKRLCKTCGLVSGSVGWERDNVGVGAGYSFKF